MDQEAPNAWGAGRRGLGRHVAACIAEAVKCTTARNSSGCLQRAWVSALKAYCEGEGSETKIMLWWVISRCRATVPLVCLGLAGGRRSRCQMAVGNTPGANSGVSDRIRPTRPVAVDTFTCWDVPADGSFCDLKPLA